MPEPPSPALLNVQRIQRALRRAREYLDANNPTAAWMVADGLTKEFPGQALGWFFRSLAELADSRLPEAVASAERARALEPGRPEIGAHLARCHMLRSDAFSAVTTARQAASLPTGDAHLLDSLASILTQFGDAELAVELLDRAIAIDPNQPVLHFNLGHAQRVLGRYGDAKSSFDRAIVLAPQFALAHLAIAELPGECVDLRDVERTEAARQALQDGSEARALLDFALAKHCYAAGEVERAATAWARGNAHLHRHFGFDGAFEAELFVRLDANADALLKDAASEMQTLGVDDAPVPIFVLGLPRAGTSLVERLLGNHPKVRLGGELQDFNTCLKRELGIESGSFMDLQIAERMANADWKRVGSAYRARLRERFGAGGFVTDKLPGNAFYVHAIAAALPEARIVHVVRDPLDNCFAIWRDVFGAVYPFAYDQATIAGHCIRFNAWMRRAESALPRRIFQLRYEQLVGVPALVTRALYRFFSIDFEDGCEDPTRNDKPVATTGSIIVRERIHGREVGAYRAYSAHLEPMFQILTDAGLAARDMSRASNVKS